MPYVLPPPYTVDGLSYETLCGRCHGYGAIEVASARFHETGMLLSEPIMEKCGACGGAGWVLTTAGLTLISFVRRHTS